MIRPPGQYWDVSWGPVTGCTPEFDCWRRCWARRMASRFGDTEFKPTCHPERLRIPFGWRKPRTVFVALMGDLFNKVIPDEFVAAVFGVMAACPHHTFLVLTKRPDRMQQWVNSWQHPSEGPVNAAQRLMAVAANAGAVGHGYKGTWVPMCPLPNVWLGVSVSTQADADERIPLLLRTPAAKRWVSVEPMLGPVDLLRAVNKLDWLDPANWEPGGLDWVVCGGETGPGARPCHPDWVRSLRDQCKAAGVAFYFKGWGDWKPLCPYYEEDDDIREQALGAAPQVRIITANRYEWDNERDGQPPLDSWLMLHVGKRTADRLLDGAEWNEMPEATL